MLKYLSILLLALVVTSARADEPAKPIDLFNGKDLAGWKHIGPGTMDVADGEMHTNAGMGLTYYTEKQFGDFVLKLDWKVSRKQDNSGIFVRFTDPGDDVMKPVKEGHEIQICDTEKGNQTGALYNSQNSTEIASKEIGQWNHYEITVVGQKYTVKLNDKVVNEFTSPKAVSKGFIGLQNHDPKSHVSFKNIQVTELKAAASRPAIAPVAVDKHRVAGLVGQYFQDAETFEKIGKTAPFYVRVDEKLGFKTAKGQFYRTKLATNFGARWNGYLRIDKAGDYTLAVRSDDGARVYLGEQLIIDNKPGPDQVMKDKTGDVTLAAGDYPLRVDYYNGGGTSGIQLAMKGEDGKTPVISAKKLFHDAAQEKVEWDQAAWAKATWSYRQWAEKYGQNYDKMDYGPFLSATVEVGEKNHALKGIAIHLGKNDEAAIVFDTDLLRFAGGWTGGFLELHGVVFDGAHGVNPTPDGEMIFTAPQLPGAISGKPSEKLSADPRPRPYGPIPREWAKYKGLHLNGRRVVLHYTVGQTDVLDTPWAESVGENVVLTRSIQIGPSEQPTTLLIAADKDGADAVRIDFNTGPENVAQNGYRYLVFPASKEAKTYKIALSRKADAIAADAIAGILNAAEDVAALAKPGAPLWDKPIVTKGEVSTSTTQPYVLDTITVPEENPFHSWMRLGGMDFFSDGRAAVTTWSGDVWIVSGIDDKLDKITWKRFATGLFQPLGLRIVDDQIYVLGRDQITRFADADKNGEADYYESFNNDCEVSRSFHEFAFDLQTDPEGNFYFAKAGPVRPGGRGWEEITANNGCVLKVSKDGSKFEVFATGVRAPNGMSVGPKGQVTVADNEGTWTPACRLSFVKPHTFLGVVDLAHKDPKPTDYDKPICWLPHGDVDNSSGGQAWVTSDKWGPFTDRMLHTSYGKCALFLVMTEEVEGQVQGGVVQFPKLDFVSGICRPRFNATDKQLYIAGLRGWQTTAAKDAGFQRVRYTGKQVQMPTELHVTADGVSMTFTTPLDESVAKDMGNYSVEQWNYLWSSEYGSAEYSVADPKEKAHDPVEVKTVTLSPDKKTVHLKLEEVVPVMQMKIQMKLKAADGSPMEYSIYNTINKVPGGKPAKAPATAAAARK
jgi:hypothetical protein